MNNLFIGTLSSFWSANGTLAFTMDYNTEEDRADFITILLSMLVEILEDEGQFIDAVEKAQKKVEENNFGIRKRLIEYDDVMNYQRSATYAIRRDAINGDKVDIDLQNMMIDSSSLLVDSSEGMSFQDFSETVMAQFSIEPGFDAGFYSKANKDELVKALKDHMYESYRRRMDTMVEKVYPIIRQVYEKQGNIYQNIAIPVSDGRKQMTLSVDLNGAQNSR